MTEHPFPELEAKLNVSDPDIQRYISALTAENLKLQRQIAKCQAGQVTLNNRITTLEQEIKENRPDFRVNINLGDEPRPYICKCKSPPILP